MKRFLVIEKESKKIVSSYVSESIDDSSNNRSHLLAEPFCFSIAILEGIEEKDEKHLLLVENEDGFSLQLDDVAKVKSDANEVRMKAEQAVAHMKQVCNQLEISFMAENSLLGIREEGLIKKTEVATKLMPVMSAIKTGDPDLVMAALIAIPAEDYDEKYINEARLLSAVNKLRVAMKKTEIVSLLDAES